MKFLLAIFICSSYLATLVISENKTTTKDTSTFLQCDTAKKTYRDAGYKDEDIYTIEQEGNLQVCGRRKTCCMANAEINLLTSSEKKRQGLATPLHHKLKEMFQETRMKFRNIFHDMMNESQSNLHSMFENTYKTHYTKNAYIIDELYKSLQQYINGSELDLKVNFNSFFGNLHEKIYVMFKSYLSFDTKYRNCIRDNTYSIKPFGEKQQRISYQMTRAFEASRVFLQGLKEGMDVTLKLLDLSVHDQCKNAFMKMTHCSICNGVNPNTKPCKNYCLNVMKGCYAYIMMIQPRWNVYITSMMNLASKLEGPFNMEALVVPLGVKISEAIMTFQENSKNITHKVEAVCGKVTTPNKDFLNERKARKVRSAEDAKKMLDTLKVSSEQILSPGIDFQTKTQEIIDNVKKDKGISSLEYPKFMIGNKGRGPTEFEKLLSLTKKALHELNDYWFLLPRDLCKIGIASEDNANCWNGNDTNGYTKSVVSDSVHELFKSNPEMHLKNELADSGIYRLDQKLKSITAQINSVIEGNGINCVDCESSGASGGEDEDGSGNGVKPGSSGESGEGITPTEGGLGSGVGGSGETTDNNNVGSGGNEIPKPTKRVKTVTPCNVNDYNCLPTETKGPGENEVDDQPLLWVEQTRGNRKGSSTILSTNLLLLAVTMLTFAVL